MGDINSRAGLQLFKVLSAELAVIFKSADIEQHIAIVSNVRMASRDEGFDHGNDIAHVPGYGGFNIWAHQVQRIKVIMHRFGKARRHSINRLIVLIGAIDNLVINISNITHVGHFVTFGAQVTHYDIKGNISARMTNVTVIVNRDPTYIQLHLTWGDGLKDFLTAAQGIKNGQHAIYDSN